jgi:D-aminoacyl-tRNA deacylase
MILMVASIEDVAGMNIAQQILDYYDFEKQLEVFRYQPVHQGSIHGQEIKLIFTSEEITETQFITDFFTPHLLIFLSRHASASRIPTLSVHTPGNLGEAEHGGIPRKVSISPASAMKGTLLELTRICEEMNLEYEVCYEGTHHGPSLDVPTMFVELGSSPAQWADARAAEAVAHATMMMLDRRARYPAAIGIGGPHYNRKFTRAALTSELAFSHMIPKYAVPYVDTPMIRQCIERTVETVELAILDWKGIKSADRSQVINALDEIGVQWKRE